MTPFLRRRPVTVLLGLAVAAALVWSARQVRPVAVDQRTSPAVAQRAEPTAPYHTRIDFPAAPEAVTSPPQPPATPKLAPAPPPPAVIPAGDGTPRPAPQSGTGWAADYRVAVCACKTRSCVGDLQAGFIRRLATMEFSEERDSQQYSDAIHEAIHCYTSLPEDS